jgi:hypothetical protein
MLWWSSPYPYGNTTRSEAWPRAKEAWANITVITRRKISLVNQLIDVAKGYQENEKLVMLKISDDLSVSSLQQANQQSGSVLAAISGMAQRFPELRASEQYSRLGTGIQESEVALENARKEYNQAVKQFNVLRTSVPHVFHSHLLGFHAGVYLNLDSVESADSAIQKNRSQNGGARWRSSVVIAEFSWKLAIHSAVHAAPGKPVRLRRKDRRPRRQPLTWVAPPRLRPKQRGDVRTLSSRSRVQSSA